MVTLLFWNINQKPLTALLRQLVAEHAPDVVALAECKLAVDVLLTAVKVAGGPTYRISPDMADGLPSRLVLLTRLPRRAINALAGNDKCAIRHLRPPAGEGLLFIAMHLVGKLHTKGEEYEQALLATRLRLLIDAAEAKAGHRRSVVMGDLNMRETEPGITSSETLFGVTERGLAMTRSRQVYGEERFYFYNPLPGMLARTADGPPGTYYQRASGSASRRWHTFDHVLIRPDLLTNFNDADVAVLVRAGKTSLLNEKGQPDRRIGSDHLPLLLKI